VLWFRTSAEYHQVSFEARGRWYTLALAREGFLLAVPPQPSPDPAARHEAEELIARIRNDQFLWVIYPNGADEGDAYCGDAEPIEGTAVERAAQVPSRADLLPPLLAALEDPDRFAAAHLLLCYRLRSPRGRFVSTTSIPDRFFTRQSCQWDRRFGHSRLHWVRTELDGLSFTLNAWIPHDKDAPSRWNKDMDFHGAAAEADATQICAVRDLWHSRLDVPVFAVAWRHAFFVAMVLPVAQVVLIARRHRRRAAALRENRCVECGYDLRGHAKGVRCPECGSPNTAVPPAAPPSARARPNDALTRGLPDQETP
jgi:hypothetical protein